MDLTESEYRYIEALAVLNGKSVPEFVKHKFFYGDEQNVELDKMAFFDKFWSAYPRKENKGQAKKAWKKLKITPEFLDKLLKAIERQKASPKWAKGFLPMPSTWLNAEAWDDEHGDIFEEFANG